MRKTRSNRESSVHAVKMFSEMLIGIQRSQQQEKIIKRQNLLQAYHLDIFLANKVRGFAGILRIKEISLEF